MWCFPTPEQYIPLLCGIVRDRFLMQRWFSTPRQYNPFRHGTVLSAEVGLSLKSSLEVSWQCGAEWVNYRNWLNIVLIFEPCSLRCVSEISWIIQVLFFRLLATWFRLKDGRPGLYAVPTFTNFRVDKSFTVMFVTVECRLIILYF
jgi:hypothetical protein